MLAPGQVLLVEVKVNARTASHDGIQADHDALDAQGCQFLLDREVCHGVRLTLVHPEFAGIVQQFQEGIAGENVPASIADKLSPYFTGITKDMIQVMQS